jgi:hypothetical protein
MQSFDTAELKYTYSPDHAPIGTVAADEPFEVLTADCFTGRFADPANFTPEIVAWVEDNLDGVTGPIAVQGAQPGEAVAVAIESVEVTTPGYLAVSRCEARSPADWWHEEDHIVNLEVADGQIKLGDGWAVPVQPLIGCLATTPARETVLSRHEGDYLGNVDCREITAGATVILPVEVAGAGLYFGDCKAAMGDGEVVAAPEGAPPVDGRPARAQRRAPDHDRLRDLAGRRLPRGLRRAQAVAAGRLGAELGAGGSDHGRRRPLRDRPGVQPPAHGQVLDRPLAAARGHAGPSLPK